jgi:hypothetical protein
VDADTQQEGGCDPRPVQRAVVEAHGGRPVLAIQPAFLAPPTRRRRRRTCSTRAWRTVLMLNASASATANCPLPANAAGGQCVNCVAAPPRSRRRRFLPRPLADNMIGSRSTYEKRQADVLMSGGGANAAKQSWRSVRRPAKRSPGCCGSAAVRATVSGPIMTRGRRTAGRRGLVVAAIFLRCCG